MLIFFSFQDLQPTDEFAPEDEVAKIYFNFQFHGQILNFLTAVVQHCRIGHAIL